MRSLVVLFALVAVACGSYLPVAQPPHYPAVVLDPHGRPLDTAEVIGARALHLQAKALEGHHYAPLAHAVAAPAVYTAPAVYAAPAAVSHQSRVDVHSSPAFVAAHAAPLYGGHALLGHSALGYAGHGHGHWLKKRSLGHLAYSAHVLPAAVSHQSRVDVVSSPALVSHAVAAPLVAPVVAHAIAPAAVSHQSRVDVRTSPAVVAHTAYAPLAHYAPLGYSAGYGVHSAPFLHSGAWGHGW